MREYSANDDVVQSLLGVKSESISNSLNTLRAEVALSVEVDYLPLPAIHLERQLTGHAEGVSKLCLAGAEFTEELRNGGALDASTQDGIQSS